MTSAPVRSRLLGWVRRYLPSEIIGTASSLGAAWLSWELTHSLLTAAIAATLAETVGFYLIFLVRAVRGFRVSPRVLATATASGRFALVTALTARALLLEFGPAEVVDVLLIRPALLVVLPALLGAGPGSWLLAKLAADLVFYAIAIVSFEAARPLIDPWTPSARARHRSPRGATP